MTDVGPGANFRSYARKELRSLMVGTGQPSFDALIADLTQEAQNEFGIDINAWPYDIAAPGADEITAVMNELQTCYARWIAHGKPTPPPLKGF